MISFVSGDQYGILDILGNSVTIKIVKRKTPCLRLTLFKIDCWSNEHFNSPEKNREDCSVPTSCLFLHSTWPRFISGQSSFHTIVMNGFVTVGNFKQCCLVRASAIMFSGWFNCLHSSAFLDRPESQPQYHLSHFLFARVLHYLRST